MRRFWRSSAVAGRVGSGPNGVERDFEVGEDFLGDGCPLPHGKPEGRKRRAARGSPALWPTLASALAGE